MLSNEILTNKWHLRAGGIRHCPGMLKAPHPIPSTSNKAKQNNKRFMRLGEQVCGQDQAIVRKDVTRRASEAAAREVRHSEVSPVAMVPWGLLPVFVENIH